MFQYAWKRIRENKIFPAPLPEQGSVFDKPGLHFAWCNASSITDNEEVDKLVIEMHRCKLFIPIRVLFLLWILTKECHLADAESCFRGVKEFIDTNDEVSDKKRKWLDDVAKSRKIPQ